MISYLAVKGNSGIYLSEPGRQMDEMLAKGMDIYEEENGVKTLIATPTEGYLYGKPAIQQFVRAGN